MRCALVLALISACTFHHAVEIGGAAVATTGLAMIVATSNSGDDCSDTFGQCVVAGAVDSVGAKVGAAMVVTGVIAAFVALVTDSKPAINQPPKY